VKTQKDSLATPCDQTSFAQRSTWPTCQWQFNVRKGRKIANGCPFPSHNVLKITRCKNIRRQSKITTRNLERLACFHDCRLCAGPMGPMEIPAFTWRNAQKTRQGGICGEGVGSYSSHHNLLQSMPSILLKLSCSGGGKNSWGAFVAASIAGPEPRSL